jgi:hypothetical protein
MSEHPCQKEDIIGVIRDELREIRNLQVKTISKLSKIEVAFTSKIAKLEVKSGLFGLLGGAIVIAVWILKKAA